MMNEKQLVLIHHSSFRIHHLFWGWPKEMKKLSHVATFGLAALTVCLMWTGLCVPARAGDRSKARTQADRALREGEFEAAERQYRALIEKDPKDEAARLGL